MENITFTVGRLLCGEVRNFLKGCRFRGMSIDYLESTGWIEREFIVKGSRKDLLAIKSAIDNWRSNDLDVKGV